MPSHGNISDVIAKNRAQHLADMPLPMFITTEGKVKYLASVKVTKIMRKAAKNVYPDISKEELMKYLTHSIRVWACVSLD